MNNIKKVFLFFVFIQINSFLVEAHDIEKHIQEPLTAEQLEIKKNHPLYFAVDMNEYDDVLRLLSEGCNVEGKDSKIPLFQAVRNRNLEIVQLLLQYGANVNALDSHGYTPLLQAAYWNDYEVAEILLKWKPDLNIQEPSYGYTALHTAVYFGHDYITKLLVHAGAQVNIQNNSGNTALHYATDRRYESFNRIFLALICPPTYLSYHAEQNTTVELLLKAGADVNIVNNENQTPLFNAVKNDFYKIIKLLLKAHASVNIYDIQGKSVFGCTQNKKLIKMFHKYQQEQRHAKK